MLTDKEIFVRYEKNDVSRFANLFCPLQGQMSGGTPAVNGTAIGVGGPRAPGDMNNNGLSGPALGPVKPAPMSMQAPTS